MQSQIPLPTDNIYKFYALFGLLLFIFSCGAILFYTHASNDTAEQTFLKLLPYKELANPPPTELATKTLLQGHLDVELSDRKFVTRALVGLSGFGFLLILIGFTQWHTKIQPREDEWTDLQLERLRFEVKQLTNSNPPLAEPSPDITAGGN